MIGRTLQVLFDKIVVSNILRIVCEVNNLYPAKIPESTISNNRLVVWLKKHLEEGLYKKLIVCEFNYNRFYLTLQSIIISYNCKVTAVSEYL